VSLRNAIDTKIYSPEGRTWEQQLDYRCVVMARNIRWDRGVKEGIIAFKTFCHHLNLNDWTLDIYGAYGESDEYFKTCRDYCGDDYGKRIRFHGSTSRNRIKSAIASASISLVPSQALEGTSLAALESMALGVPCVSTAVGGLQDLPTIKSETADGISVGHAITHVYRNYKKVRDEQLQQSEHNFSMLRWAAELRKLHERCDVANMYKI